MTGYPWAPGATLTAADLNAAVSAARTMQTVQTSAAVIGPSGTYVPTALIAMTTPLLVVQVEITTAQSPVNYNFWVASDGDLTATYYQATGITAQSYQDNSPFYIPAPAGGELWIALEAVDDIAADFAVTLRIVPMAS